MPERVVDVLEAVQVEHHDGGAGLPPFGHRLGRLGQGPLELHPVGQPGQGVVHRVVPELVDQAPVLQRDPGVVGDGLQQQHVVGVERAHLAHAVRHAQAADHARLPTQRDDDDLPVPFVGEPLRPPAHARAPGGKERAGVDDDELVQPVGVLLALDLGAEQRAVRAQLHLQEALVGPGGDEVDDDVLRSEQLLRLAEHAAQDGVDLRRAGHDLAEPVEPLQAQVPVGQAGVGPVAEQQPDGRDHDEPRAARVGGQAEHANQGDRRHEGAEHLADDRLTQRAAEREAPFVHGDDRLQSEDADAAADQDRHRRCEPGPGVEGGLRGGQGGEDVCRDGSLGGEQGDVERRLER